MFKKQYRHIIGFLAFVIVISLVIHMYFMHSNVVEGATTSTTYPCPTPTSSCQPLKWPCTSKVPDVNISKLTNFISGLLTTDPNIMKIIIDYINNIINNSQTKMDILSKIVSNYFTGLENNAISALLNKFNPPDNNKPVFTTTLNEISKIILPVITNTVTNIMATNTTNPVAIQNLKNAINDDNFKCLRNALLNEVNVCNLQNIFTISINNKTDVCPP